MSFIGQDCFTSVNVESTSCYTHSTGIPTFFSSVPN